MIAQFLQSECMLVINEPGIAMYLGSLVYRFLLLLIVDFNNKMELYKSWT